MTHVAGEIRLILRVLSLSRFCWTDFNSEGFGSSAWREFNAVLGEAIKTQSKHISQIWGIKFCGLELGKHTAFLLVTGDL